MVQCLVNEGVKVRALVRDYTKVVRQPIVRSIQHCMVGCQVSMCPYAMCRTMNSGSCLQNSDLYTNNVEVIKGDVYQYSTLPAAMKGW